MKTTLELPDPLFRRAKAAAAERGQSLKQLVAEALSEKLSSPEGRTPASTPPWMKGFGGLRRLHKETATIQAEIDRTFRIVEPEDRA